VVSAKASTCSWKCYSSLKAPCLDRGAFLSLVSIAARAAINALGAELFKECHEWPQGYIFERRVMAYEEAKYGLAKEVANNVADYSMSNYANMVESTLTRHAPLTTLRALKATQLYDKFSSDNPLGEPEWQEFYVLSKLSLSEITHCLVKAPVPRDVFDSTLVPIATDCVWKEKGS
jgi:hypothetical protein